MSTRKRESGEKEIGSHAASGDVLPDASRDFDSRTFGGSGDFLSSRIVVSDVVVVSHVVCLELRETLEGLIA